MDLSLAKISILSLVVFLAYTARLQIHAVARLKSTLSWLLNVRDGCTYDTRPSANQLHRDIYYSDILSCLTMRSV